MSAVEDSAHGNLKARESQYLASWVLLNCGDRLNCAPLDAYVTILLARDRLAAAA